MKIRALGARVFFCSVVSVAIAQAAAVSDPMLQYPDHYEFSASLHAPLRADASGNRQLDLWFDFPGAGTSTLAAWQVDIQDSHGHSLRRWIGEMPLPHQRAHTRIAWDGLDRSGARLAPGFYTVRLRAVPSVRGGARDAAASLFNRVHDAFVLFRSEQDEQAQDVMVGKLRAPRMPAFAALAVGTRGEAARLHQPHRQSVSATGSLPYTIYYGNLHSQTNHSDGAGPLTKCTGEQNPQSGQFGPPDAYAMMQNQAHGDFLMTSEHNHMFDGSTSTNASANPATAKALFASGLTDMANYNSAHPGFLALYGVEWGVISNGGHMNIFNADGLPEWEYNSSGQLIGDYYTPKSDYAGIYATMKAHGWIGQFNHPQASQFAIGGTGTAYDANGDQVMVAAEILNSYAFSTNTTQTESQRSNYQNAFNQLLERGYHVAPTSGQDNHCSNWGLSYHNRTGVLLPTGTPLNVANFLDALRARRVFAAEDDSGQLILTANGQLMGQTISNSGPLTLTANYASSSGQTASRVQFFTGVPGSNGTVSQLYEGSGTYTTTPGVGAHFYYVQVTQANGDRLWSAPIWVNQTAGGGDTTPPTVSATETGGSGTITLSASASDNVGVSKVEFYVDGVLKGNDASSPFSMALDSTTLANGSHTLTAKAYDAAGNVGTSSGVSFSISNSTGNQFNEVEPNDRIGTANHVARSYAGIVGTVGTATDKDYFKLNIPAHSTLTLNLPSPGGVVYDVFLTNSKNVILAQSTLASGAQSLSYANTGSKGLVVYAKVASQSGFSATASYVLAVAYHKTSTGSTERITNGGFEAGNSAWMPSTAAVINNDSGNPAHAGSWKATLDGTGTTHTDTLMQQVTIPSSATSATLGFWLQVASDETTTSKVYDTLAVQVRDASGNVLATLHTYSNLDKGSSYVQRSFDLSAYKGQSVQLNFVGSEDKMDATTFLIDDVSLQTH